MQTKHESLKQLTPSWCNCNCKTFSHHSTPIEDNPWPADCTDTSGLKPFTLSYFNFQSFSIFLVGVREYPGRLIFSAPLFGQIAEQSFGLPVNFPVVARSRKFWVDLCIIWCKPSSALNFTSLQTCLLAVTM